ncbi:MAG TPA: PaaI family thioesterase [Acidimicrobiales bacterium]
MSDTPADERPAKDMDRWLGDGGMAIIAALGGTFETYGADHDGWVGGRWVPTALACNPHGIVQAGVHSVVHDAAMNFAINAGLRGRDRTRATLELKSELLRVANSGDELTLRGEVVRQAKLVAYAEARVTTAEGALVSKATATFLLHRDG